MRAVVTGAAGFIGSHLAGAPAAAGHEVLSVDDALERIGGLLGTAAPTVAKDPAPGDVARTRAGTGRTAELLARTGRDDGSARQTARHRERAGV